MSNKKYLNNYEDKTGEPSSSEILFTKFQAFIIEQNSGNEKLSFYENCSNEVVVFLHFISRKSVWYTGDIYYSECYN